MQSVSREPLTNPYDIRYTIFAAFILSARIKDKGIDIIQLIISSRISLLLDDVEKIDFLVKKINDISVSIGLGRMMLSRHGLMPADRLNSNSDVYTFHLTRVMGLLKEAGYQCVLSYGTLLGAIREGRFLSHDDDVDILYLSHEENINDVLHERECLFKMFSDFGYTVSAGEKNMNFHVKSKADGVLIDVFPSWIDGDCINLHMAKMKIDKLIAKKIFPSTSTALINGVEFPIPEDSRYFLEERYGPFYFSSEKYFEWRWPVNKNKKMKVGLTYGTFDLLHHGHVRLLERIKARCDILIVGVSSDAFNSLKNKKSYQDEKVRMKMVSSLLCVDHVFYEDSWDQKINDVHRFTVTDFFMGDDWLGKFDFLSDIVNVNYLERTPDISSSKIKCDLKIS